MRPYQQKYIDNIEKILNLSDLSLDITEDSMSFLEKRQNKRRLIGDLVKQNTALLREELFPLLDDIISASQNEINDLISFAEALTPGARRLDNLLSYTIHNALVVYARHWNMRDMLIRELYNTAMALFYLQSLIDTAAKSRYRWNMRMLFGEAASFIKVYDDITVPEIRGYIHRSMGNLALGYTNDTEESNRRKMTAIRQSLRILTDPVYQEKTPSLPWDVYIYKSHQERTTSLAFLRAGNTDPVSIREVMESAEYVWRHQQENSQKTGKPLSNRWHMTYEVAQYHCGIYTLDYLLTCMEEMYMRRNVSDYTLEGIYNNIFIPSMYAEYLSHNGHYRNAKKEVLGHMYRMMLRYVRSVPADQVSISLIRNLMGVFQTFIEYPDGIRQSDFLLQLVVCRMPEEFIYLQMTASVSRMLMEKTLESNPSLMSGVLGLDTTEQILESRDRLAQFTYESGMFHDIGQLNFTQMTSMATRSWLKEEKDLYRLHTKIGADILARCESTRLYADTAAGHHRYYNEQDGYPENYSRKENPNQPVTDIVSLASFFIRLLDNNVDYTRSPLTLPQAMERIKEESGRRLSPELVRIFLTMESELTNYLKEGEQNAYRLLLQYLQYEATTI